MAKRHRYVCTVCGHEESGWVGKCPACDSWGTMEETVVDTRMSRSTSLAAGAKRSGDRAKPLPEVEVSATARIDTGMAELDRVLGGGLVPDSVTMLTAQPGAGKSTLLLQVAGKLAEQGIRSLYASGEESTAQIKARALRILPEQSDLIYLISTNSMDQVLAEVRRIKPAVLFVDSVQTLALEALQQRQGTPTQTVQVTAALVDLCKQADQPMAAFLIGHMTKGDEMAGLRTLEHLVDTVIYLDNDGDEALRLLRSTKNRFGYTGEIGLFRMEADGLEELSEPDSFFLTDRAVPVAGSAVALQKEGSRMIPIEIEALVSPSYTLYPNRIAESLRKDTLNTLISILEEKAGCNLSSKNVVIKATGGLSISEKSCDLATIVAIASALRHAAVPPKTAFLAEVGLTGELKAVRELERRIVELSRLGFETVYITDQTRLSKRFDRIRTVGCHTLNEVLEKIFGES